MRYSRACRVGLHGRCSHNTVSCQPTADLLHIRLATCRWVPTIRPVAMRFRVLSVSCCLLTSRRARRNAWDRRTDTRPWLTRICHDQCKHDSRPDAISCWARELRHLFYVDSFAGTPSWNITHNRRLFIVDSHSVRKDKYKLYFAKNGSTIQENTNTNIQKYKLYTDKML